MLSSPLTDCPTLSDSALPIWFCSATLDLLPSFLLFSWFRLPLPFTCFVFNSAFFYCLFNSLVHSIVFFVVQVPYHQYWTSIPVLYQYRTSIVQYWTPYSVLYCTVLLRTVLSMYLFGFSLDFAWLAYSFLQHAMGNSCPDTNLTACSSPVPLRLLHVCYNQPVLAFCFTYACCHTKSRAYTCCCVLLNV